MAAAATDISKLLIQVDASVELLKRNLASGEQQVAAFQRNTEKHLSTMERNFRRLDGVTGRLQQTFAKVSSGAAALGVGFSALQLGTFIGQSIRYASSLGEVSQQLGVTTRDLQVYRFIASQVGIEQSEMDSGLSRLTRTIGQAATGGQQQQRVFQKLGLDIRKANGEIKTAGDLMPELADRLSQIESPAQRAAVLVELFGRSGQKLDVLLAGGSAGIRNMTAELEQMNGVLTNEEIRRADDFADKIDKLKTALKVRIASALSEDTAAISILIGDVGRLVTAIITLMGAFRDLERLRLNLKKIEGDYQSASFIPRVAAEGRAKAAEARRELDSLNRTPLQNQLDRIRTAPIEGLQTAAQRGGSAANIDIDDLNGGSGARQRTQREAYEAFRRELQREGIRVTSGFRSTAEQARLFATLPRGQAARPGTSDHEFYKAVDLPANADPAKIAAAAMRAGVTLGTPLVHKGTGMHRHQPFTVGRSGGGGEADIAREMEEAERARKEALEKSFRATQEIAEADLAILRARLDAEPDYAEQAVLALQIAAAERAMFDAATDHRVQMGEISEAQGERLKELNAVADEIRRKKILAEKETQRAEEVERLERRDFDAKMELLGLQADLATTAAERRKVELRILELAREEERRRLQNIVDTSRDPGEVEAARRGIVDIDRRAPAENEAVRRRTMGPLEELRSQIPDTAAEMNEELERVAASGLASLNDGLVDAIMGARSLGDVFKNVAKQIIADLLRIAVQQTIVNGLMQALGGVFGGGKSAGITTNLNGRFSNQAFSSAISGGRASGGPVVAGQAYMVGEVGRELFIPSVNGNIVSNATLRQGRGGGSGDGGVQTVRVLIESDDEMFRGRVREVSGEVVAQAAPRIVDAASRQTLRVSSRQRLG